MSRNRRRSSLRWTTAAAAAVDAPVAPVAPLAMGLIAAGSIALSLAGCAEAGDPLPPDARVTIDTVDGVPHVISGNRGAWVRGGSWRVQEDGGVVIGVLDGPDPYTFGRISGVVVGDDGRIYVADRQALEVRVFSADGDFERRLGRAGAGPGEFRDISGLARAPEGIAVMDGAQASVAVFSPDGAFLRSFRLHRPHGVQESFAVMRFDRDGRFHDRVRLSGNPRVDSMAIIVYSPGGEPVDTTHAATIEVDAVRVERGGVVVTSLARPFAAQPSLAIGPDGLAYFTTGDRYRVVALAPGGDTVRVLRRDLRPPPVTAEERTAARSMLEERYREATGGDAPAGIELPATKPLITRLHVDRVGNLWVGAATGPSWRRLEWAVHDPEGRYLGPVATPMMVVTDIGENYVAGVRYDELGVQRAAVYPLAK